MLYFIGTILSEKSCQKREDQERIQKEGWPYREGVVYRRGFKASAHWYWEGEKGDLRALNYWGDLNWRGDLNWKGETSDPSSCHVCSGYLYFLPKTEAKFTTFRTFKLQKNLEQLNQTNFLYRSYLIIFVLLWDVSRSIKNPLIKAKKKLRLANCTTVMRMITEQN